MLDALQNSIACDSASRPIPIVADTVAPPVITGAATLFTAAMRGAPMATLIGMVGRPDAHPAAQLFDTSILYQIAFRRDEALGLQNDAVLQSPLLRVHNPRQTAAALRVLALMMPGDTQSNMPLDFITNHLDVRLDLLFMRTDGSLPPVVPDHDVMIFCASYPGPALLVRMAQLYRAWPRPVLNDPALLPLLARDALPRGFAEHPALCFPPTVKVARLDLVVDAETLAGLPYPVLIRPHDSHAGCGLAKVDSAAAARGYLDASPLNASTSAATWITAAPTDCSGSTASLWSTVSHCCVTWRCPSTGWCIT